jgi:hypothetical protein
MALGKFGLGVGALVLVGLIGLAAVNSAKPSSPDHSCTVTEKHAYYGKKGSVTRRISTSNCGTFEVQSSLIHGELRPGHLFGAITIGHEYQFTAYGNSAHAIGVGLYPNIVKAVEVGQ